MQLLLSKAGHERVQGRITAIAPDLQIVTVDPAFVFRREGVEVAAETVDPELVWGSLDTFQDGLLGVLFTRLLEGSRGQWIQLPNAGLDRRVFKRMMAKGVRLTKSSAQASPIAEYVVAHALSLLAPIERQRELQAARQWAETPWREIGATRWLLAGYGSIGQEIAQRAKAFGAQVTAVRRSPQPDALVDAVIGQEAFVEAAAQADVVVLACPLTDETRHIAGPAFFQALKPGAILINIGRGGLLDEDALRAGLDRDQPAHAVLDVFESEPLPADAWFWDHPKVRVSAHTSHAGLSKQDRADELFLKNLQLFLGGHPLIGEAAAHEVGL